MSHFLPLLTISKMVECLFLLPLLMIRRQQGIVASLVNTAGNQCCLLFSFFQICFDCHWSWSCQSLSCADIFGFLFRVRTKRHVLTDVAMAGLAHLNLCGDIGVAPLLLLFQSKKKSCFRCFCHCWWAALPPPLTSLMSIFVTGLLGAVVQVPLWH